MSTLEGGREGGREGREKIAIYIVLFMVLFFPSIQISAAGIVALKFVFPMWSASRVTHSWNKAVLRVNCSPTSLQGGLVDHQVLVNYMRNCEGGFRVFGIRVSDSLLLVAGTALVALFQVVKTAHNHF